MMPSWSCMEFFDIPLTKDLELFIDCWLHSRFLDDTGPLYPLSNIIISWEVHVQWINIYGTEPWWLGLLAGKRPLFVHIPPRSLSLWLNDDEHHRSWPLYLLVNWSNHCLLYYFYTSSYNPNTCCNNGTPCFIPGWWSWWNSRQVWNEKIFSPPSSHLISTMAL